MRVAVLGAGYAGLTVARRLERTLPEEVDLVVVNDTPAHLVQHELHRLIRYPGLTDAIRVPLDDILAEAELIEAEVLDVDTVEGTATLATPEGEQTLDYDLGAVCLGAETEFYGLAGVEDHATPLKRVEHAEAIREQALAAPDGEAVVGGGGLSGVQAAGELADLAEADLDVTLVEMADQVAPGFDETFAGAVRDELDARGVTVETGATIDAATADAVDLEDGRSLPADVFVWAGGIRGPDALDGTRSPTAADLRVSETTFVLGDAAEVTDENGESAPASAQTAVRQARVAARNIAGLAAEDSAEETIPVEGDDEDAGGLDTYRLDTPGWVVSVGNGAVAQVGPIVFSGEPAKAAKAVVGAGHLGSVGAIKQASELVAEELGWPTPPVSLPVDGKTSAMLPTDPASPSEIEYPLSEAFIGVAEALSPGETVDLTGLTRGMDPSHPGNPFRALQEGMTGLLGAGGHERESTDGTTIEVTEADDGEDNDASHETDSAGDESTESDGDETDTSADEE